MPSRALYGGFESEDFDADGVVVDVVFAEEIGEAGVEVGVAG